MKSLLEWALGVLCTCCPLAINSCLMDEKPRPGVSPLGDDGNRFPGPISVGFPGKENICLIDICKKERVGGGHVEMARAVFRGTGDRVGVLLSGKPD